MSSVVFETSLTESEKTSMRQRVRSGCQLSDHGHLVINGIEKDEYSKVRIYLRGQSYSVNRAKVCYYVDNDFQSLPSNMQLSHLCHVKSCVHPDHITMESASTNNSRKKCFEAKMCLGHPDDVKDCVL